MTDLARKYRPQRFADVAGQSKASAWLRKQVTSTEGRSVLLSGAYGTGKSSLALIYAKALLCAAPADGEPCDTCERCKQFGDGRNSLDFQRFEAGEHSKVDEVLGLLTIARHCPSGGTRRVQLLDELHNLSRRAFDALLRIIEMPPAGTTFILVTSKPEALPAALRSRLTQLELNLFATDAATHFLTAICRAEGFAYEAPAGRAAGGRRGAAARAASRPREGRRVRPDH